MNNNKPKYEDVAVGWLNTDKNGKRYLAVTLKRDMAAGEKLFLRKNEFKKEGEKSPDYRYAVLAEEQPEVVELDDEDDDQKVPF